MKTKLMICLAFLMLVVALGAAMKANTLYFAENITVADTISAYTNANGVFAIPLDGLLKQQSVRVYFRVSDGRAKATLYDDGGKKIKPERDLALVHDVYRIPADGDYCLRIEANAANFTISVSVVDTKEQ